MKRQTLHRFNFSEALNASSVHRFDFFQGVQLFIGLLFKEDRSPVLF
jgi:hypothetical protein